MLGLSRLTYGLLTLAALLLLVSSKELAWNGHLTPGSTTPSPFTPYYVPPGAKSYDSSSPLVHYSGQWTDSYSRRYVDNTLRSTTQAKAAVTFTFTGTGVEWFGCMDKHHGVASVWLDGKKVESVDAFNDARVGQQRMFSVFGLKEGKHTIKIVNEGISKSSGNSGGTVTSIDAFVVTKAPGFRLHSRTSHRRDLGSGFRLEDEATSRTSLVSRSSSSSGWSLEQKGTTGVHAMQLAVISSTHAIVMDKVEHNLLTIDNHPAWGALYNLKTHVVTPLHVQSNSFCAGGTFLSNGTLINVGGNPVVTDKTAAADFGDVDGLQAVRLLEPCDGDDVGSCDIVEDHSRLRMASPRWYNTVLRIDDGSAMIIGGSKKGGWMNNASTNNPTIEFFPPKNVNGYNGLPVPLPFLSDTLNSNLFPIAFSLPDGRVFMAANRDAMIYDWKNNVETRLPQIPNGVRVTYPMTGTALLLPLSPSNNYTPEILLCGGSTVDDTKPSWELDSQDPASAQCSRLVLNDEGIQKGWEVDQMPEPRTMLDAVLLPTGQIVIANGAKTGISGYGNVKNQVGASNADNPALTPLLYDPSLPLGQRFVSATPLPSSDIPRLYHSVATLTPDGSVMIAGSNPNLDRSSVVYGTEYRVEWLRPAYMQDGVKRPVWTANSNWDGKLRFGQDVNFGVDGLEGGKDIKGPCICILFLIFFIALILPLPLLFCVAL